MVTQQHSWAASSNAWQTFWWRNFSCCATDFLSSYHLLPGRRDWPHLATTFFQVAIDSYKFPPLSLLFSRLKNPKSRFPEILLISCRKISCYYADKLYKGECSLGSLLQTCSHIPGISLTLRLSVCILPSPRTSCGLTGSRWRFEIKSDF